MSVAGVDSTRCSAAACPNENVCATLSDALTQSLHRRRSRHIHVSPSPIVALDFAQLLLAVAQDTCAGESVYECIDEWDNEVA